MSEQKQGLNLVEAAMKTDIKFFVWSTVPSSVAISKGKYNTQLYEGKFRVEARIREVGLPAVFIYAGNFFENTIYRKHVFELANGDLEFHHPVILIDTECRPLPCVVADRSGNVIRRERSLSGCQSLYG